MMADRAALESPPAEPHRLQRAAGDPDRGEEVALAAAHDHVPAQPAGPDPKRNGLEQDDAPGEDRLPTKPAVDACCRGACPSRKSYPWQAGAPGALRFGT